MKQMLTNRLYLSAIGVVVVFAVSVAYLLSSVLDQPITHRPARVHVSMASTGGLFVGSAVTYRGVKIGKVTAIELEDDGVRATASITDDRVPADTRAVVRSLSPIGEQYLDFQPRTEKGPYLHDGSTLVATSKDLPTTLASTVVAVDKVLRQIDDEKLHSLLGEVSTGLRGTGQDVGKLADHAQEIIGALDKAWPQTERLIDNTRPALEPINRNREALLSFAASARQLAAFLRDYDPELRTLLARAPGQLKQLDQLVQDAASVLPAFLDAGVSLTGLFVERDPAFRSLLANYAPGLATVPKTVRNKYLYIELILSKDQRCRYGNTIRTPHQLAKRPLYTEGRCSPDLTYLQRGAAHAPRPN